jgi:molybdenum cofactor guanylyltransferase
MVMTQNDQPKPGSNAALVSLCDAGKDIVGVLLSGGQSRRMGGGDKALRDLGGQPMLMHAIDRLRPQVGPLVINANGDPARFAAFGLPIAPDTIDGFVGPLAGVLAGMLWAKTNAPRARWIATVSTDAPFLPHDLVMRLTQSVSNQPEAIAIAQSGGEVHPVIGLWPVAHASDLEQALRNGVRKVLAWTDRHGTVAVDFPFQAVGDDSVDPFFNANHPEELELARRLLAGAQGQLK